MQHAHAVATGWTTALEWARPWQPTAEHALVIVPHPDDEAVMFGGLIALAARQGTTVDVVTVTDGEAAYQHVSRHALAALRLSEQTSASQALGVDPSRITRMGLQDGGVAEREHDLTDAISDRLASGVIDLLVAPWEHDHHTDHEACGRAARRAAERSHHTITAAFGLFWSLLREEPAPGIALRAIELAECDVRRKRRAIDRHPSQVTALVAEQPVLGTTELAITRWPREHYVVVSPRRERRRSP